MTSLFPDLTPAHDPGGKVTLRLQPGVRGAAEFYGDNQEYRLWLSRWWGDKEGPYALWIAMNPSTARADADDPTIRREIDYSREKLQVCGMLKCNVMDYRATHPKDLMKPGVEPCSPQNIRTIVELAKEAQIVIVAYGALHKKLRPYAGAALDALEDEGIKLWCMGRTKDGSPRHPLYMPKSTELQPFTR